MIIRNKLPLLFIFLGLGIILVALGVDLIGLGYKGIGTQQIKLALYGITIMVIGIILDMTVGQHYIPKWLVLERKFLTIVAQLGLIVLVIRQYHIESPAFYQIIILFTFFGFIIHHFLHLRYRLHFFFLLSVVAIFKVIGLINCVWLLGIGIMLIGICHLPISYLVRVVFIITAGAFLVILRAGWINTPWASVIWPILGTMFMFRLIVYMYDIKHYKIPFNASRTLSYFFLLPNVVFPLFPVVDYNTFYRNYYNEEHCQIYQRGVKWMFWGIIHILLYRLVYFYMCISPTDVTDVSDLIRYMVSTFLLYLRISGQFHLIVGILLLFGFNLPRANNLYYLSTSFTDWWRRANIYWKDFMMKVFYYPAFFKLRKLGVNTGMVLATFYVFILTWLLHSYQWFWLRGTFPITWKDAIFWGIFGSLMVINTLYEAKYGRKRTLGPQVWTFKSSVSRVLRTVGTFSTICILWSLWTSSSVTEWFSLWHVEGVKMEGLSMLIPTLFVLIIVLWGISLMKKKSLANSRGNIKHLTFLKSVFLTGVSIFLLYLIGNPMVNTLFGLRAQEAIREVRIGGLNKQDTALLHKGYYEDLVRVDRFNTQLWEVYLNRENEVKWKLEDTEAAYLTNDFLKSRIVPMSRVIFQRVPLRTNRWGMRDKDYNVKKSHNIFRIALIGGSVDMGWGVRDNHVYEWLLEERLNLEYKKGPYAGYEILNFSVPAYTILQRLYTMENKVLNFEPDAIFIPVFSNDEQILIDDLAVFVIKDVYIPYEYLREIIHRAGTDRNMSLTAAKRSLKPFAEEILSWSYCRITEKCLEQGILPVWVYIPIATKGVTEEYVAKLVGLAEKAGFIIINLSYISENIENLNIAEWDRHPNAIGHKLISDRLYEEIIKNKELFTFDKALLK